jgi:hypothetical protein
MSKETLENLPTELQEIIFSYAIKCKKDQNFYINKQITKLLNKRFKKCEPYHMLNAFICQKCDKNAFMFMQYMGTAFI